MLQVDVETAKKQQFVKKIVEGYTQFAYKNSYDLFKRVSLMVLNDIDVNFTTISEDSVYCNFVEEILLCILDGGDIDSKIQNMLDKNCKNNPQAYFEMFFSISHLRNIFDNYKDTEETLARWVDKLIGENDFAKQYISEDDFSSLNLVLYFCLGEYEGCA